MPVIARYAIVTLAPLTLMALAAFGVDVAAALAVVWLFVLGSLLDPWMTPPGAMADGAAPWSDRLSAGLAVGHILLIALVFVGMDNPALGLGCKVALFVSAASWMGQISHPNAHDLIHRPKLWHRQLGALVYTVSLFGHHVSAHRFVHHLHVGTEKDPATPLPGESFWAYAPRAWIQGFRAGYDVDTERMAQRNDPPYRHPYAAWVGGAVLSLIVIGWTFGIGAVLGFLVLAGLMHIQILLSDYVQHYGLQRLILPDGRIEAIAAHHSWNAPRGFTSLLMMNAPSHSEHHLHPARPFESLGQSETGAPQLPASMPVMAVAATIPPLWHRIMDRRALRVMEAAQARVMPESDAAP